MFNPLEGLQSALATQNQSLLLGLSFAGGILSSLLPCTLGMLPIVLAYILGQSSQGPPKLWPVLSKVLLFVLGLALVFAALGLSSALLGQAFGYWLQGGWLLGAVGLVAVLMGLQLLGWLHLPLPSVFKQLPSFEALDGPKSPLKRYGLACLGQALPPLLLGMTFGLVASPCGTPYLAVLLAYVSQSQDVLLGGLSLAAYALGQGMPLLVLGLLAGQTKRLPVSQQFSQGLSQASGFIFIGFGLWLGAQALGWV